MKRKPVVTVNLVRSKDSDTYEVVNDMTAVYATHDVIREKTRVEGNMYGYFYVKVPK